jgi:acetyl esterase
MHSPTTKQWQGCGFLHIHKQLLASGALFDATAAWFGVRRSGLLLACLAWSLCCLQIDCSGQQASDRQAAQAQRERIAPTHAEVAYGEHPRQVLDFYQAQSTAATPLMVYIHGGGFVGGNKASIHQGMLREALSSGISVAALHYRFVDGEEIIFPIPQRDCARALQFLRSKSDEWQIDPGRVACFGGSAGAGISMWLGFHEDLADADSRDPVARQSTRIVAIGTMGGQGTYDPIKIKELVGGRAWEHPSLLKIYGLETVEEALHPTPEQQRLYDEGSAITHLTADDPPLFMIYSEPDIVPPADSRPGQFIHHPNFGKQLKKAMDELGIENVYVHTDDAAGRNPQMDMLDFFKQKLGKARRSD